MGISVSHILLVAVVVFLLFGVGRLPALMADLAKGLRAFKDGLREDEKKHPSSTKSSKNKKSR